jgi:hypothetical protein
LIAFFHHEPHVETPVRATLADGQVLMGEVQTRVLRLATGAGILEIPLADVGEVVPAHGDDLGVAEGRVDVWLRNGSELRGAWSEPALAMGIAVGGTEVPVDLPMNDLARFQLQGREAWPTAPVFRMRTTWGDDFLVDPARTRLVVENHLGTFEPLLQECVSAAPVGAPDGDWRIVLRTGTVLIGRLHDAAVTVALPMGPKAVTVPLENFVSLRLESWAPPPPIYLVPGDEEVRPAAAGRDDMRVPAENRSRGAPAAAPSRAAAGDDASWFDSSALESAKSVQPD